MNKMQKINSIIKLLAELEEKHIDFILGYVEAILRIKNK